MKISTKGRYALRLLLDLAQHQQEGFIPLRDIAERQHISKNYLEQIVPLLNKAGMLRTNRGFQGGYQLASPPDKYTVGDVLRATEGSIAPVACLDTEPEGCDRSESCLTLPVWRGLHEAITGYLDSITLADVLENNSEYVPDFNI